MNKTKQLDWEKEFEIKYGRNSGRLTFYNEQKYYWNNKFYDEIKDFIQSLLTKQRTELLEEILELLLIKGPIGGFENSFNNRIKEVFNNLIDNKDE